MDKNSTTKLNVAPQICGTRESARARTKMNSFGQGTFTDNEIFRNRLAGIEVRESGHPKIIRNKIYGHESSGGVYVHHYGRADLEKNDVYHNSLSVLWGKKNVDKICWGVDGGGILWEGVCVLRFFQQEILVAHKCNQKVSEQTLQRRP